MRVCSASVLTATHPDLGREMNDYRARVPRVAQGTRFTEWTIELFNRFVGILPLAELAVEGRMSMFHTPELLPAGATVVEREVVC